MPLRPNQSQPTGVGHRWCAYCKADRLSGKATTHLLAEARVRAKVLGGRAYGQQTQKLLLRWHARLGTCHHPCAPRCTLTPEQPLCARETVAERRHKPAHKGVRGANDVNVLAMERWQHEDVGFALVATVTEVLCPRENPPTVAWALCNAQPHCALQPRLALAQHAAGVDVHNDCRQRRPLLHEARSRLICVGDRHTWLGSRGT
mmetsp:Transcript_50792/g.140595  ORF Transcript_50792/g.140595 Transcript_50792/m.140595 type:complete len:204 (+) Transcript_50792:2615-3226(+)|eukprot:2227170-Prymnesium_polylepis.2